MTNRQVIKAQDVQVGDVIAIDQYASLEVATIHQFKTQDGTPSFTYYDKRGAHVWNRKGAEMFKLN
ncbi:hypothetical protein [Achromobacter spanius]|uniref:hypothetical protein n=1 Tax=Achromobacter spanius TaxID=217203 RepID=UPI0038266031